MPCVIMEEKNNTPCVLNNFYVHTHKKKKEKKKEIFNLSRFYASDSVYSTQKQIKIMAPFASRVEA